MLRRLTVLLALVLSSVAFAQNAPQLVCYSNVAQTIGAGVLIPMPGATVSVCSRGSSQDDCTNGVTLLTTPLYQTTAGTVTWPNPITADAGGNYSFCTLPMHFSMLISGQQGSFWTQDANTTDDFSLGGTINGNVTISNGYLAIGVLNNNGTSPIQVNSAVTINGMLGVTAIQSGVYNDWYSPTGGAPTIEGAISAAGVAGAVLIPGNWPSTDNITLNQQNLAVLDGRPHNPNNTANYTTGIMPKDLIFAADYGALCNGANNDTGAIQAALNALDAVAQQVAVAGALPMTQTAVQLPQGRCMLSNSLIMTNYGSLLGAPGGTALSPFEPWQGSNPYYQQYDILEVIQAYNSASYANQPSSTTKRRIQGIDFWYLAAVHPFTAIHVFNVTGHTSGQPYPSGALFLGSYQLPGVTIEDDNFYGLDSGVVIEDCQWCEVFNNTYSFVRAAITLNGNINTLHVSDNFAITGSYRYTTITTGPTLGIDVYNTARYVCTGGGVGSACSGGTTTQTQAALPVNVTVSGSHFEAFDQDGYFQNVTNLNIHDNEFLLGGAGPQNVTNPGITLVNDKTVHVTHNTIQTTQTASGSNGITVMSNTQGVSDTNNADGLWLASNSITSTNATGSLAGGITFPGTQTVHRNVYVEDNQIANYMVGIRSDNPLQFSRLVGNYFTNINGGVGIYLNAADPSGDQSNAAFQGLYIDQNTTPDPIRIYQLASANSTGLFIRDNVAGNAFVGGQTSGYQIASGPGCAHTTGAGQFCTAQVAWSVSWQDTNYQVLGCTVTGETGIDHISPVVPTNLQTLGVYEVGDSSNSTGGGTVQCVLYHN